MTIITIFSQSWAAYVLFTSFFSWRAVATNGFHEFKVQHST